MKPQKTKLAADLAPGDIIEYKMRLKRIVSIAPAQVAGDHRKFVEIVFDDAHWLRLVGYVCKIWDREGALQ